MIRAAIEAWHELLDDELAADTQHQLDAQLRSRGLFFGDRPLCTVLRPRFISTRQYQYLQRRASIVLRAFDRALTHALDDDALLSQFRLSDWETQLIRDDPGFRVASPTSRLDAFFVGESGGLRFTEYNAETPAGAAYNDVLTELFFGLPSTREFVRDWELRPLPSRHTVIHALLDSWKQWSSSVGRDPRALPRVTILDWNEVPTRSEFLLFQDYFQRQGLECDIVDPRDCTYADGKLTSSSGPVELIYKRVLISELVEREGIDSAVVRAVREGAACLVNPFRCKVLHKKASLAVLSDERNSVFFSDTEREAIDAHIPWTRVVEDRSTIAEDGSEVDLLEHIAEHRDQLVLKPNDEYGGKGIVLGWDATDDEWTATVKAALDEPYIVQRRIELLYEPYPSLVDGRLVIADRMVDTAPYVVDGSYIEGILSRLSTAALGNVTAGGGSQVPTFVVEPRGS